jgi:monoamine oxidase
MNTADIIIIGAGACGLAAARTLSQAGKKILLLEARNRIGGRIYTETSQGFALPIEAGAEFVHGDLPLTQALLQEAGVGYLAMTGNTYQVINGELQTTDNFIPDYDILLEKLTALSADIPFSEFLNQYLPAEQFAALREAVTRFAEGYDAADITKVSTFALREEWLTEGATNSHFPAGGYSQLMHFMANQITMADVDIHLNTVVKKLTWEPGQVTASDSRGKAFRATKAIITIPLGVLQATLATEGYISIEPALPDYQIALQKMGFGAVIKILLQFKTSFWETSQELNQRIMPDLGFLFTDAAPITAWWTHLPNKTPLLTGWLAGLAAEKYSTLTNPDLVELALDSLAQIFKLPLAYLREQLQAEQVYNWVTDPFARGAYAYATVGSYHARHVVAQPVEDTLYFASEAFYEGPAMGTVEAALASGQQAAHKIIYPSGLKQA